MRHVAASTLLILMFAGAASAADFDIPLASNEHVSDAVAFDDGTALVAVASLRPRASRLFTIANGAVSLATTLPGMTVTELRWAGGGAERRPRILVGGGIDRPGGAEYQYRLVELGPDAGALTLWDSSVLREPIGEEDSFQFSRTGWAVLREGAKRCVVEYGAFGSSRTARAVLDAGGGDATLAMLDAGRRTALLIVARGGNAYALDTSKSRPSFAKLPLKDVTRVEGDTGADAVRFSTASAVRTYSANQILTRSMATPLAVGSDRTRKAPSLSGKVYEGLDTALTADLAWWRVSPTAKVLLGLRKGTTGTISMRSPDPQQRS